MMENSGKIKNILYKEPRWILKFGNVVIFSVLVGLILVSYFIKEPDTVRARGTFIKEAKVEEIRAKKDGEIGRILYSENDIVPSGALIATLNAKAEFQSVQQLANSIRLVISKLNKNDYDQDSLLLKKEYDDLGEMQQLYEDYLGKYRIFKNSRASGIETQRKSLNLKNKITLDREYETLESQLKILNKKIELRRQDYDNYQKLFEKNIISASEFRMRTQEYLDIENQKAQLEIRFLSNQQMSDNKHYDILEIEDKIQSSRSTFFNATISFFNELDIWLDSHSLKAKNGGKLIFNKNVKPDYFVSNNETVFFTDPSNGEVDYSVELNLGTSSLGKIQEGQTVKLAIPAYPYQEFGYLTAKIAYLPEMAIGDTSYRAKADLIGGRKNRTSLDREIKLKHGLYTDAHIVTKERSLLMKLLQNFRREY